jgi:hypothetical protein
MEEILKAQLEEYQNRYNEIQDECYKLWRENKPWREKAAQASGLSQLIEHTKNEILIVNKWHEKH